MKLYEKKIEAVCDCGASVSCLSPSIYNELKQTHKFDLQPCLRKLKAANGLPIEVKGVIRLHVVIGPKSYEHDFCVLGKSACLLGLDFLETNKCNPLFYCMKLQLDSHSFFPCITESSTMAMITFFESFRQRRSQFLESVTYP